MRHTVIVEDLRMCERIYNLLIDCGMPQTIPTKDLFLELYWMLEEHFEEEEE